MLNRLECNILNSLCFVIIFWDTEHNAVFFFFLFWLLLLNKVQPLSTTRIISIQFLSVVSNRFKIFCDRIAFHPSNCASLPCLFKRKMSFSKFPAKLKPGHSYMVCVDCWLARTTHWYCLVCQRETCQINRRSASSVWFYRWHVWPVTDAAYLLKCTFWCRIQLVFVSALWLALFSLWWQNWLLIRGSSLSRLHVPSQHSNQSLWFHLISNIFVSPTPLRPLKHHPPPPSPLHNTSFWLLHSKFLVSLISVSLL